MAIPTGDSAADGIVRDAITTVGALHVTQRYHRLLTALAALAAEMRQEESNGRGEPPLQWWIDRLEGVLREHQP